MTKRVGTALPSVLRSRLRPQLLHDDKLDGKDANRLFEENY